MTDELANVAAEAQINSVLPDDDDILDGNLRTGGSIHSTLGRRINTITVEHLASKLIPAYWSPYRDKRLRDFARKVDYLGIGLYNAVTKVTGIVPYIAPHKNADDFVHPLAMVSTQLLHNAWMKTIPGMLFDVLSQDNGGFLEIVGGGGQSWKPLPPVDLGNNIVLPAIGLKNIDAGRTIRTGNPQWPIRVEWNDGNSYVMHHTRVIDFTQLPSTDPDLNGIGLCAVSRVINSMVQGSELDQILIDILSTGLTGEIILAAPFESDDLEQAYKKAEERSNDQTKPNTQKYVFVGVKNYEGKLEVVRIPLRRVPEGMTKQDMVAVLMQMVAATLSIDFREIWPSPISGNAKSDASTHDKKTRSKFIKEWVVYMKQQLTFKFAPLGALADFDFTDPAELQEIIEGRKKLAETHKIELANGTIDVETAIKQLSHYGYLDEDDVRSIRTTSSNQQTQTNLSNNAQRVNNLFVPSQQRSFEKNLRVVRKQEEDEYVRELRRTIAKYKSGVLGQEDFILEVSALSRSFVIAAYLTGAQKGFQNFTEEDFDTLEDFLDFLDSRVDGLEEFLSKTDDEDKIFKRTEMWESTILKVYYLAHLYREDQTQTLTWVRDPLKDSCSDCVRLDGQTHTIAEWREIGFAPRAANLECTGINCGCVFV